MQGSAAATGPGVTRKRSTKWLKYTVNLFRNNLWLKDVANYRLKATRIIDETKAFYRQRIPESSCARKETAEIDILVTSSNVTEKSCNLSELREDLLRE